MSSEQGFKGTYDLMLHAVESQRLNRSSAGSSNPNQSIARPPEMMIPLLLAWVEQPHRSAGLGIERQLTCALSQRAMDAGQRKIVQIGRTSGNHGHDMIDMKRGRLPEL